MKQIVPFCASESFGHAVKSFLVRAFRLASEVD